MFCIFFKTDVILIKSNDKKLRLLVSQITEKSQFFFLYFKPFKSKVKKINKGHSMFKKLALRYKNDIF